MVSLDGGGAQDFAWFADLMPTQRWRAGWFYSRRNITTKL
jgi:hypothetical protein